MGLLTRLRAWLGSDPDDEPTEATAPDDDAEPKLDPNGVTERRVTTDETAVEALKQTRNDAEEQSNTEKEADER